MTRFVGRHAELTVLRSRLDDVRRGRPSIVQVQGAAGIGKTALIDHFLTGCGDARIVRASGDETEALLSYGVVEQLARSAGPAGSVLLEHRPAAGDHMLADHVTVGVRILELLDATAGDGPVVLVLDDAHWADLPSLQALIFAWRRLVADQILVVVARRDEETDAGPPSLRRLVTGHRGTILRLRGLDEGELRDIAAEMGVGTLSPQAARRLRRGTEGNPLYARALLEELPADEWNWPQPAPLPSPRAFRLRVMRRRRACSAEAGDLVDAAAVLGLRAELATAARLGDVGEPLRALEEASEAELLGPRYPLASRSVEFPHPLTRSAVYDGLGPARRAELHATAATLMADEAGRLRHRVRAAAVPDAALAADLDRFAVREADRQSWPSAVAHLVEASRLSPDGADGRRRLLRAVNWMLLTGDAGAATALAEQVAATAGPSPHRDSVLGYLAIARREPVLAQELLDGARTRCDADDDPRVAASIALHSAIHWYGRMDGEATVRWSRRALELTPPGGAERPTARMYLGFGLAFDGRMEEAFAALTEADPGPDDGDHGWVMPRAARGLLRLAVDDVDGAQADLRAVASGASRIGVLHAAAVGFAGLARAEYLTGAWDDAVLHAERAIAVNAESAYGFIQAMVLGTAALVPTARGEWPTAEAFVRDAAPRPGGYERETVAAAVAAGRLAASRGDAGAVLAALEPVCALADRNAVVEPGFWPWQDLYAEALAALGRVEEADRFLAPHEALAEKRGRQSCVAALARARGRVDAAAGRPDAATAAFERGLEAVTPLGMPYEQARIELAYGRFLRRTGRRRAAAARLGAAHERFAELGADPDRNRCARELAASGLAPAAVRFRDLAGLTSQELVVARLAAAGRTNREVAGELMVSVKTVEFHLHNAYRKLGVTSRRLLGPRLAALHEPPS